MADEERRPRWNGQSDDQHESRRTSARISPPLIKRYSSDPSKVHSQRSSLGPTGAYLRVNEFSEEPSRRYGCILSSPVMPLINQRHNNSFFESRSSRDVAHLSPSDANRPRHSLSALDHGSRRDANKRREGHTNPSNRQYSRASTASASSASKPICVMCSKATNVKYDPLIACPGCGKHYHDSCRRPPLIEGVNP